LTAGSIYALNNTDLGNQTKTNTAVLAAPMIGWAKNTYDRVKDYLGRMFDEAPSGEASSETSNDTTTVASPTTGGTPSPRRKKSKKDANDKKLDKREK
jgi:hypothetical protein